MVSSCNNLVSADVPLSLQKLSHQALNDYGLSFKELPVEQALKKLREDTTKTAAEFSAFLKNHGHRCLHEVGLSGAFLANSSTGVTTKTLIIIIQTLIITESTAYYCSTRKSPMAMDGGGVNYMCTQSSCQHVSRVSQKFNSETDV